MPFPTEQYVQHDLEADRQVANTLAELIIGGLLAVRDSWVVSGLSARACEPDHGSSSRPSSGMARHNIPRT